MGRFVPFAYGFRPFFLMAGIDAVFNMCLWLVAYFHPELWPEGTIPAMYWHGHEMLFGFAAAAIGGFLLTTVPAWTGRPPFAGMPLAILAAIWLAGRIAMLPFAAAPPIIAAFLDLVFFPALVVTLAPPLVRAGKIHNLPFVLLLSVLFLTNLLFHLGRLGLFNGGELTGLGFAADIVMILIVVIGGRIIPGFTHNGLVRHGVTIAITPRAWLDIAAIASIVAVLVGDLTLQQSEVNGAVALLAAVVQGARLAQWHGHRSWRDPLIWILHVGYGWLIVGLGLKGIWLTIGAAFAAKWLHAITVGAFATMILAVMTRAALGHTGRPLIAPKPITLAYFLVTTAAAIRVFGGAVFADEYNMVVALSGACWIAAFGLFVWIYAPILTRPRADGRPG